ncbi:YycC family protein [Paenibacillus albicereus]|uniref:YycC family protein n=1 Tax=Paenibacillus albicereus TaxID=2726185 RepID=A0A6H2GV33_9BACL|nr:YycC family protein [Paenibacillus albicereus]QJC51255.1 YycC family protein [Paenibacillus albicereus]
MSRPLPISADTAVKLAKQLGVPLEHLMHMPRHILLQKMAELAGSEIAGSQGEPSSASRPETPEGKPGTGEEEGR